MISNLDTIKPKLYEKYPELTEALIDLVLKIYFEQAKQSIQNMDKPEVALLWATLKPNMRRCKHEIEVLERILKNRNSPDNPYTENQLQKKEKKLQQVQKIYSAYQEVFKNGKISINKKRNKDEDQTIAD